MTFTVLVHRHYSREPIPLYRPLLKLAALPLPKTLLHHCIMGGYWAGMETQAAQF